VLNGRDDRARLTVDELASATGCDAGAVHRWHDLGLLVGDGETFPLEDIERGRLILYAERRGVHAEEVAEACRAQGDVLGEFGTLASGGSPRIGQRVEDAIAAMGADGDALRRLWVAAGLGDQEEAYDEDAEALWAFRFALDAGLPEDALAQLVRVYADALGRVGEAENRLFHDHVHERLRAKGLEGEELQAATNAVGDPLIEMIEPTVLYFHRKAFQRAVRDDFLRHVTEARTPPGETIGEMTATILFVDLSGFTPLTESMGDDAAARVVERFSDLVREAARRHAGKVVKQIGDEFMLVFADPSNGVQCGLDIGDAISVEPQFPAARVGAHHGSLLYREGDYIGTTVNIAARVTDAAGRSEFLVTSAVRENATLPSGVDAFAVGPRALKGISGEVELYRVDRGTVGSERAVDPVCQMSLDAATAAATVSWQGRDVYFCSSECAERFTANPDRYEPGSR